MSAQQIETLNRTEALSRFPGLTLAGAHRQAVCPDAESFATRIPVSETGQGLLLQLPARFEAYLPALACVTPNLFMRLTSDLMHCWDVLCWSLPGEPKLTIDIGPYLLLHDWYDCPHIEVIWTAGGTVMVSTFPVAADMVDVDHITSFSAGNYKPWAAFSEEDLAAARGKVDPLPDPWTLAPCSVLLPGPAWVHPDCAEGKDLLDEDSSVPRAPKPSWNDEMDDRIPF